MKRMNIQNKMRFSVLVVLMLAATFFSFAQNNDLNHGVLEQPSTPNQNFSPLPSGGDVIINNYPQQQPVVQPVRQRPIYQPSRRVTTPVETVKKDTVVVQQIQQSNFLSENGVIWWIIIITFILLLLIGILIGLWINRRSNRCYESCNGYRVNCGGGRDWNMNHHGHIDHGFPTTFKHEVKVAVTGIPSEILMKAEMPPKIEEVPPITNSDTKPIGQQ